MMSLYDKYFFYTEKQSRNSFGYNPPGRFDAERRINNKPYWQKPNLTVVKKKKTLILSDWTGPNWSLEKRQDVIRIAKELTTEGFSLYVWQDGQLVRLTQETTYLLEKEEFIKKMMPVEPKKLIEQAVQYKLPKDQLHIIDDYWLEHFDSLKMLDNLPPRTLRLSELCTAGNIIKITEIIKQSVPKYTTLHLDIFSETANRFFVFAKEHMEYLNIQKKYTQLILNKEQYDELKDKKEIRIGLNGLQLHEEDMKDLEDLSCKDGIYEIDECHFKLLSGLQRLECGDFKIDKLQDLLKHTPNIKRLIAKSIKGPNKPGFNDLNLKHLSKLKTIQLDGDDINDLQLPSQVKVLIISDISGFNLKHLTELESLSLSSNFKDFSQEELEQLFPDENKIKTLSLQECSNLNYSHLNLKSFKHLEEVHFYFGTPSNLSEQISTTELQKLLDDIASPGQIKKLSLSGPRGINLTKLNLKSLTGLEDVKIYGDYISLTDPQCLFDSISNKIKKITFLNAKKLNISELLLGSLPELEELILTDGVISVKQLNHLLSYTPNKIRKLHLTNFNIEQLDVVSLPKLEDLRLDFTTISAKQLNNLLAHTPNRIKRLQLLFKYENTDGTELDLSTLSELEIFTISNTTFSASQFQQLLANNPNMRDMTIKNCCLDREINLKDIKLPFLTNIYTDETFNDAEKTQLMKCCAPNIPCWIGSTKSNINTGKNPQATRLKELPPNEYASGEFPVAPTVIGVDSGKKSFVKSPSLELHPYDVNREDARYCDANTQLDPNMSFDVSQIFYSLGDDDNAPPPVTGYRLRVFNDLKLNEQTYAIDKAFTLMNTPGDLKLSDTSLVYVETNKDALFHFAKKLTADTNNKRFFGRKELLLDDQQWQALPSLTAADRITHFQVDAPFSKDNIEIKYSERDNLYYIKSIKGTLNITFNFLIQQPLEHNQTPLPKDIAKKIEELNAFISGSLSITKEDPTGKDYLEAMQTQKKGSCRHRAIIFKEWMQKNYRCIPTRIITNDCHAFVEIFIDKQWVTCELGGYTAQLNIKKDPPSEMGAADNDRDVPNQPHPSEILKYTNDTMNPPKERLDHYKTRLKTWNQDKAVAPSVLQYCQEMMQPCTPKKHLITIKSTPAANALLWNLQQYGIKTKRPVFYIDSPDDLVCSAPFVKRLDDNKGEIKAGPGGPLYDFLTASYASDNPPVLLVNYNNFNADDIVRFNALLDKERRADGTTLPEDMLIIGVLDINKDNCYQGADFYSRFDKVALCAVTEQALQEQAQKPLLFGEPKVVQSVVQPKSTNLYNGSDWKARLLGSWTMHADGYLYFEEGVLQQALKQGSTIHLKNAPIDDPQFNHFWQQALLHKEIYHAGLVIKLPNTFTINHSQGYDWNYLVKNTTWDSSLHLESEVEAETLNPSRLGQFLSQYTVEGNQLNRVPGIIAKNKNKTLHVNVTRSLNDDEWARILDACAEYNVTLIVHNAPSTKLPEPLNTEVKMLPGQAASIRSWKSWNEFSSIKEPTAIVASNDTDTTVALLKAQQQEWMILDVSECSASDLLTTIHTEFNEDSLSFKFEQKTQALLKALDSGQSVILKGVISTELADGLSTLILQRQTNQQAKGRLVIVSEDEHLFDFMLTYRHRVTKEIKIKCLSKKEIDEKKLKDLEPYLEKEPLSRLHARLRLGDESWQGMDSLSRNPSGEKVWNEANSLELAQRFTTQRINAVMNRLAHAPYVYLTGLTAVGKSTFVEKELSKGNKLFRGETQLSQWATFEPNDLEYAILFIDEANLTKRQWSEFEGLFNNPPGILVDGTYHQLSSRHKVIFAGNPLQYGNERTLAPLFYRHGNALLFEPLPMELIAEEMIKPVFKTLFKTEKEAESAIKEINAWCAPILNIYKFLCNCSQDEVLISPRELQMMALLTVSYCKHHPESSEALRAQAASYYAYQLAKSLVPAACVADFESQFKSVTPSLSYDGSESVLYDKHIDANYLATASRQAINQQLTDWLTLHEDRRFATHDTIKCGGLGGIVLEGEPGIGKSELVIHTLLSRGYKEVHDLTQPNSGEKSFYRMPVSMQISDKEHLLLKAFDEGSIVIIDEISSILMDTPMERLLNDLLMGKNPKGEPARKPGFMVIGTQNPLTMAGRRAFSPALSRRLLILTIPAYPHEEMIDILVKKGLNKQDASCMVQAYEMQLHTAKKHNFTPEPTFRDVLRLADEMMRSQKAINISTQKAGAKIQETDFTNHGSFFKCNSTFFATESENWLKCEISNSLADLDNRVTKEEIKLRLGWIIDKRMKESTIKDIKPLVKSIINKIYDYCKDNSCEDKNTATPKEAFDYIFRFVPSLDSLDKAIEEVGKDEILAAKKQLMNKNREEIKKTRESLIQENWLKCEISNSLADLDNRVTKEEIKLRLGWIIDKRMKDSTIKDIKPLVKYIINKIYDYCKDNSCENKNTATPKEAFDYTFRFVPSLDSLDKAIEEVGKDKILAVKEQLMNKNREEIKKTRESLIQENWLKCEISNSLADLDNRVTKEEIKLRLGWIIDKRMKDSTIKDIKPLVKYIINKIYDYCKDNSCENKNTATPKEAFDYTFRFVPSLDSLDKAIEEVGKDKILAVKEQLMNKNREIIEKIKGNLEEIHDVSCASSEFLVKKTF